MFWYHKINDDKASYKYTLIGDYEYTAKNVYEILSKHKDDLEKVIAEYKINFSDVLKSIIDSKGIKQYSTIYKPINMPKQVFQRIIQGTQKPSKDSAIKLAFALDIEVYKITYFLELAGYTLCNTDTRDMILEYCFITQKTINEIDEILCKYNQKPLFKKE